MRLELEKSAKNTSFTKRYSYSHLYMAQLNFEPTMNFPDLGRLYILEVVTVLI